MPIWGESKDSKGRDKVAKVREMEAIVKQKERDQRKAEEAAASQRQPHVRKRLQKRYGIGDGTTTQELLDRFTGGGVEPEPEPQQVSGSAPGGGGGKALVLSGSERQHLRSHVALPKSQQRENTKAEVDRLRQRLGAIERRNTMTLEQYFPPENLALAQERLEQLRLNTTGYLARKAAEHKQKEKQEAEAKREREKSADILTAASVGDHVQLQKLLDDELKEFNGAHLSHHSKPAVRLPPLILTSLLCDCVAGCSLAEDCAAQGKTGQAARDQRLSFESDLVKQKDDEGRTALHYAASFGFLEVARLLCSSGANPSERDPAGYTPLHFACRWDQSEVAECASRARAYPPTHARTRARTLECTCPPPHLSLSFSFWRRLMFRARWAKFSLIMHVRTDLLTLQHYTGDKSAYNVNIDASDQWGQTPLHVASLAGHAEVVELLLRKNCDIHAKDEDGKESVDVARDAATLAQLNAVLHGRPSVKTLQMQEEARQADLDELAEELADYQYVGEDGEILGVGEEDAEDLHALAVCHVQTALSVYGWLNFYSL